MSQSDNVLTGNFRDVKKIKVLDQLLMHLDIEVLDNIVAVDDDTDYGIMVRAKIAAEKADRIKRAERPLERSLTVVRSPERDDTGET